MKSLRSGLLAARRRPRVASLDDRIPAIHLQRRHLIGEIMGVLANPAETVRSLAESRKLLAEAREEMKENQERMQIGPKHTFSPLPGFFHRTNEMTAIERLLSGVPTLTILFGGTSAGKTALLRQVLTQDRFHILAFDLRIAGFADLSSLYFSLSNQMEQFFMSMKDTMEGYDEFEKESWAFKHDRIAVDKRMEKGGEVKTSDIAHLMELFQSSLLKYWNFEPDLGEEEVDAEEGGEEVKSTGQGTENAPPKERVVKQDSQSDTNKKMRKRQPPVKKIPVMFFDEAHKLPLLIKTDDAMKSLLDAMLVLTKQDRLIHVIHATSDSFFMQWVNVLQHATFITVGDASYVEARMYFQEQLLSIPEQLHNQLDFEKLYAVFGGKLAHHTNYLQDFVNAEGDLSIYESSHFLQAYALVNLQLVHSKPDLEVQPVDQENTRPRLLQNQGVADSVQRSTGFTSDELMLVMRQLADAQPVPWQLPYFQLSHQLGTAVVDALIRARLLQLRWTPPITAEGKDPVRRPWTGPVVLPSTPVMGEAMRKTLEEQQ